MPPPILASAEIPLLAHLLLRSRGQPLEAGILAQNEPVAPSRVVNIIKSAIAAGTTTDPAWAGPLVDMRVAVAAFVKSLRSQSVFARLLPDMRKVPLRTRIVTSTTAITGQTVGEAKPKAVSSLSLADGVLEAKKAATIVIVSDEVALSTTSAGLGLVSTELRAGVGAALDALFLDIIVDGATPIITSTGTSVAQIAADLKAALDSVNLTGASRLFWVMTPAIANGLATLIGTGGNFLFTGLAPSGGELLAQPALVTDQLIDGRLLLVDASGIAAALETITLDGSDQAALELDSAPTDPPAAGAVVTSLWQRNLRGLKAETWMGAERLRDTAVAALDGLVWPS
jgi:HK97 family phage major capsid protein